MSGPHFIGIGAQRCGTTWTYAQLRKHPRISFPGGKEIQFWSKHRDKGLNYYQNLFTGAEKGIIQGEISPAYAILQPNIISVIHETFPNVKLFYITRDPIERALSGAVKRAREVGFNTEDIPMEWFRNEVELRDSILRTCYSYCIKNWLAFFDPSSLLLLNYRGIHERPAEFLDQIAFHVGADMEGFSWADNEQLRTLVHETPKVALPSHLKDIVISCYKNKDIQAQIGYSLSDGIGLVTRDEVLADQTRKSFFKKWYNAQDQRGFHISKEKLFIPGWMNLTASPEPFYAWFGFDAKNGLFLSDESFDHGYLRMILETLDYKAALNLLFESFRILKPGGTLRLQCRDFEGLIKIAAEQNTADEDFLAAAIERFAPDADFFSGPQLLNAFVNDPDIKNLIVYAELRQVLEHIGFINIHQCTAGNIFNSDLAKWDMLVEGPLKIDERLTSFIECKKPA